jgi:c-di-GMP-binding flagellar brake protein YcgR
MPPASNARGAHSFAIGQRLEIGVVVGDDLMWLASRLEDQDAGGERLVVAWPTDAARRRVAVTSGQVLHVSASTPQDALYAADAVAEDAIAEPVPLLTLRVNRPWQRLQRRNAVRVGVAIRPRVAAKLVDRARQPLRLGLTNLSATGVQVRSQDELSCGDLLDLAFELMGVDEEVQVQARVRRVYRYDPYAARQSIWDAGCEFESLPDLLGRRIVQYIFTRQRALAHAKRK